MVNFFQNVCRGANFEKKILQNFEPKSLETWFSHAQKLDKINTSTQSVVLGDLGTVLLLYAENWGSKNDLFQNRPRGSKGAHINSSNLLRHQTWPDCLLGCEHSKTEGE